MKRLEGPGEEKAGVSEAKASPLGAKLLKGAKLPGRPVWVSGEKDRHKQEGRWRGNHSFP